jgi:hypothetical protein
VQRYGAPANQIRDRIEDSMPEISCVSCVSSCHPIGVCGVCVPVSSSFHRD